MKVLIVGSGVRGGTTLSVCGAFKQVGVKTEFIDSERYFKYFFLNRVFNRFHKIPKYWGTKKFNDIVIKKTKEFSPDFILFLKPILITPLTVEKLKKITKVFSWYPDYIRFTKTGSTDFFNSIPLYDCHFSFNFENSKELLKMRAKNSIFLPCAADPDCHSLLPVSEKEKQELGADVIFLGTYAKEKRSDYLEHLCNDGYDIKIYGNDWGKHPKDSCLWKKGCIQSKALYCSDMSKVFNSGKVILSFVREHNKDTISCRTYEIPVSGGFMLHQRNEKVVEAFKEGEEADFFSSYEEMKGKIDFYLENDELRKKIAQRGRERTLREGLFIHRVKRIIEVFEELN